MERSAPAEGTPPVSPFVELAFGIQGCEKSIRALLTTSLAPFDMTHHGLFVLLVCQNHQRLISQVDIAKEVGISTAQLSVLIEQLRKKGLLRPHRDPADRRRQTWELTTHGEQVLSEILWSLHADFDRWAEDQNLQQLALTIRQLSERLREDSPSPTISPRRVA